MNAQSMTNTPDQALSIWMNSLVARFELHAPTTYAHCHRTAAYAGILGRRLGLTAERVMSVEKAVLLHDAGTMQIPDRITQKAGRLSDSERHTLNTHSISGYALLSSMSKYQDIAEIILAHHEQYDGRGYPHRLEGHGIPLGARICAVVDCLDALTSPGEMVRRIFTFPEACRYIASKGGTRFDPQVIDAFRSVPPEQWRQLQNAISQSPSHERRPPLLSESAVSSHFDKLEPEVIAC